MDTRKRLREGILHAAKHYGSLQKMIEKNELHQPTISKIVNDKSNPQWSTVAKIFDALKAEITFPFDDSKKDITKSVHFVKPKIVTALPDDGPIDDDYIAVPLASMPVAAGRGIIPEDKIRSWILVWKGQEAVRHRGNLAAVEIGPRETSMIPTLHPKDIVLIDRDDYRPKPPPGNIYLVREPQGDVDGLAIKRVRFQIKNNKELIVFYSDNTDFAPDIYDMETDYSGEVSRAVVGRVIWSWSDMTKK